MGAAYLINGGCSDDGFEFFRGWLVTQGRATSEAAVGDPDSLAAHRQVQARSRQGAGADDAYEAVTGQELPVEVAAAARSAATAEGWEASMGEDFDFDDPAEPRRRYPRLWALYRWCSWAASCSGSWPWTSPSRATRCARSTAFSTPTS